MPHRYLSKEEIRDWRSSLEKITLEEYAKKLGKEINEKKETRDIVDIMYNEPDEFSIVLEKPVVKQAKTVKEEAKPQPQVKKQKVTEIQITFKKKLTDREEKVFEYLKENKGRAILAKELAELLDLPRDYIYKYIRSLRKKIEENILVNADQGGFILNI